MKKLLQLLNEYQNSYKSKFIFSDYDEKTTSFSLVNSEMCLGTETIISKKYGFIKWLRSHDRIRDFRPLEQLVNGYGRFQEYESRLMLLSIQDEPISFLISILK